jgi:hypothetical protein
MDAERVDRMDAGRASGSKRLARRRCQGPSAGTAPKACVPRDRLPGRVTGAAAGPLLGPAEGRNETLLILIFRG